MSELQKIYDTYNELRHHDGKIMDSKYGTSWQWLWGNLVFFKVRVVLIKGAAAD